MPRHEFYSKKDIIFNLFFKIYNFVAMYINSNFLEFIDIYLELYLKLLSTVQTT